MTRFFTRDRIVALVIFLGSLAWGYGALRLPPSSIKGVPGPAFFPLAIFMCLIVFSLILFIQGGSPEKQSREKLITLRQFVVIILMFLYILLVPWLGFPLATFVSLAVIMIYSRQEPLLSTLLSALLISLVLYLCFNVLLKIPLPSGELFS